MRNGNFLTQEQERSEEQQSSEWGSLSDMDIVQQLADLTRGSGASLPMPSLDSLRQPTQEKVKVTSTAVMTPLQGEESSLSSLDNSNAVVAHQKQKIQVIQTAVGTPSSTQDATPTSDVAETKPTPDTRASPKEEMLLAMDSETHAAEGRELGDVRHVKPLPRQESALPLGVAANFAATILNGVGSDSEAAKETNAAAHMTVGDVKLQLQRLVRDARLLKHNYGTLRAASQFAKKDESVAEEAGKNDTAIQSVNATERVHELLQHIKDSNSSARLEKLWAVMHGENLDDSAGAEKTADEDTDPDLFKTGGSDAEANQGPKPEGVPPIAFIKTHRTGSSSVASLIHRIGDERNMSFFLPEGEKHANTLGWPWAFPGPEAEKANKGNHQFDIICNNAVFNYKKMKQYLQPWPLFMTMLRNPATQIQSSFDFFQPPGGKDWDSRIQWMEKMSQSPDPSKLGNKGISLFAQFQNPQSHDLGWYEHVTSLATQAKLDGNVLMLDSDDAAIDEWLEELDDQLGFVMLSEYYDEGLVLLSQKFNLDVKDMKHIVMKKGGKHEKPSKQQAGKLSELLHVDNRLYQHFNETFWRQWEEAGGYAKFSGELKELLSESKDLEHSCEEKIDRKCPWSFRTDMAEYTDFLKTKQPGMLEYMAKHAVTKKVGKIWKDEAKSNDWPTDWPQQGKKSHGKAGHNEHKLAEWKDKAQDSEWPSQWPTAPRKSNSEDENEEDGDAEGPSKSGGGGKIGMQHVVESDSIAPLAFVRTHRTGGSTIANLVHRLGDARDMLFALPDGDSSKTLGWPASFPGESAEKAFGEPNHQFDAMCADAVFNEGKMRAYLKHKPFFFTALRSPLDQARSSFEAYNPPCGASWEERIQWLEKVQETSDASTLGSNGPSLLAEFRNPQAHDLGWYEKVGDSVIFDEDSSAIHNWLKELERSFGLVILTEYFNEGLVLLSKKLGVQVSEMKYMYMKHGGKHDQPNEKQAKRLKELYRVDAHLYEHFNKTFWKEWEDAGGYLKFGGELRNMYSQNQGLWKACSSKDEDACPQSYTANADEYAKFLKAKDLKSSGESNDENNSDEENQAKMIVKSEKIEDTSHDEKAHHKGSHHEKVHRRKSGKHHRTMPPVGFIKTHKTGGGSMLGLFHRLGDERNLSFVLPAGDNHGNALGWPAEFPGQDAVLFNEAPKHQYDVICNNAVFSDLKMRDYLKPSPLFFTILRSPAAQLQSSFNGVKPPCGNDWDSRLAWMDKLAKGDDDARLGQRLPAMLGQFRNPQAHDLGWYAEQGGKGNSDNDSDAVHKWISSLDRSLGFVMLTDYFDEGLVLLRRKLGLEVEDMAYTYMKRGLPHGQLSKQQEKKMEKLNHVDTLLFKHFNKTFWKEWEKAGGDKDLQEELQQIKTQNAALEKACAAKDQKNCPWRFRTDNGEYSEYLKAKQFKVQGLISVEGKKQMQIEAQAKGINLNIAPQNAIGNDLSILPLFLRKTDGDVMEHDEDSDQVSDKIKASGKFRHQDQADASKKVRKDQEKKVKEKKNTDHNSNGHKSNDHDSKKADDSKVEKNDKDNDSKDQDHDADDKGHDSKDNSKDSDSKEEKASKKQKEHHLDDKKAQTDHKSHHQSHNKNVASVSGDIVMNYFHNRGLKCGSCGDANDLKIGSSDETYDKATRNTAILICGPVCDLHDECAGFNYVESEGHCQYRKATSCQGSQDDDRDCYTKVSTSSPKDSPAAAVNMVNDVKIIKEEHKEEHKEVHTEQKHNEEHKDEKQKEEHKEKHEEEEKQKEEHRDEKHKEEQKEDKHSSKKGANSKNAKSMPPVGFIKTHRTGSSTLTSIMDRLGDERDAAFVLPAGHRHSNSLGWPFPFPGPDAAKFNGAPKQQFDVICNNAVYNDKRMRQYLKPDPVFFTVLRNPLDQIQSAFDFFHPPCGGDWDSKIDWLEKLQHADNPQELGQRGPALLAQFHNPQAHDLGWYEHVGDSLVFDQEDSQVENWLDQMEQTLGFVMLTEYFDEGLILLRRKLGLEVEDLKYMYMKQGVEREGEPTKEQQKKLRGLINVDSLLYDHFSKIFWKEWKKAGGDDELAGEVKQLRSLNKKLEKGCADKDEDECPWQFSTDTVDFTDHLKKKHDVAMIQP